MKHIFRNIAILLASAAVVLGTAGCDDKFLDTTPSYSFSSANVWESPILARAALNGVYNTLYQRFSMNCTGGTLGIDSDCYSSVMDLDNNWKSACIISQGNLTPSTGNLSTNFKYYYSIVYRANDVINNIDKVIDFGMTQDEAEQIKAEALFLRAYAYYNLNVLWGGVPIYTENPEPSEATNPRSSVAEVWTLVETDLKAAINHLPAKVSGGEKASQASCYALLGFVKEFQGNYAEALAAFKNVETCGASLFSPSNGAKGNDDYFQLFKPANEKNDEILFAIACVESTDQGNPRGINYGNRCTGGSAWNNYLPNPAYVERFEEADGSPFNWEDYLPGYTSMTPKERSVFFLRDGMTAEVPGHSYTVGGVLCMDKNGSYTAEASYNKMVAFGSDMEKYINDGNEARIKKAYEDRDPRLTQAIITPYGEYYGNEAGVGNHLWTLRWPYCLDAGEPYDIRTDTNDMWYYLWRKYVTENDECTTRWVYSQNIYLIRYAEVLLHRAECEAQTGDLESARKHIDMVRGRAGHILLSDPNCKTKQATKEDLIELARNEMYVELGGEDSMYFNELRWGTWYDAKFFDNTLRAQGMPYKSEANGLMEMWGTTKYKHSPIGPHIVLYPFPAKEREMNPSITQNPGYTD